MSKKNADVNARRVYEFIKANQRKHNTRMMCRLLDVAPSGYYAWYKKPISNRAKEDKRLLRLIRAPFAASHGVYGRLECFSIFEKLEKPVASIELHD